MYPTGRMIGFLMLMTYIGFCLPLNIVKSRQSLSGAAAIFVSFPLLLSESSFFAGISLCLFGLILLSGAENSQQEIPVFLLTTVFYTAFFLLYKFSPHVWYLLRSVSLAFSAGAGDFVGNKMTLGSSAMGIPITVSAICYAVSRFITDYKKNALRVLLTFAGIIAMNVIYLWLQKPLTDAALFFNRTWNPNPLHFQAMLLLLVTVALYPLAGISRSEKLSLNLSPAELRYAISALLLVFIAVLAIGSRSGGRNPHADIVFIDKGADWNVPFYGKIFGQNSAGMFGMLPNYLNMRGYETKIIKDTLREKDLENAGVAAVFNPVRKFSDEEKKNIHKFVENGGSLLIAGDHTDVTGVMNPINDLLEPVNIRLNFDTALPLVSGWAYSLEKRPHPIFAGITHDYDTAIWVGASLKISSPARPVIVGKLGWADIGNYFNTARAFLGDYRRSSEEQLGDIVLVAESAYGKGKILVFGDTSTFQNSVLTGDYAFIDNIFDWLSSKDERYFPGFQLVFAVFLLIAAAYLFSRVPCTAVLCFCILSATTALWITELKTPEPSELSAKDSTYKIAYIDISHNERFSPFASTDNSAWGISVNLMRNRYLPLFMKEFSEPSLSESSLFIVIAPTAAFSQKEIAVLKHYMEKGGSVIFSVGWEDMEASASFLKTFGFSIDAVPLGPAEIRIGQRTVKFAEAWPLLGGDSSKQIIAEKSGYPIAVYQPVGKGGLLLIGDSKFFQSRNIESYQNYLIDNIAFFKYLMDGLKPENRNWDLNKIYKDQG